MEKHHCCGLYSAFFYFSRAENRCTCVCTNLLGFLLIIPMTTSFIEGRSPPFISPIYSPCETIERRAAQDVASRRTAHFLAQPGNNSVYWSTVTTITDSAGQTALLRQPQASDVQNETEIAQKCCSACRWWKKNSTDTYMIFLVLFFHSTQGVMQRVEVWSQQRTDIRLCLQLADPACSTLP